MWPTRGVPVEFCVLSYKSSIDQGMQIQIPLRSSWEFSTKVNEIMKIQKYTLNNSDSFACPGKKMNTYSGLFVNWLGIRFRFFS